MVLFIHPKLSANNTGLIKSFIS